MHKLFELQQTYMSNGMRWNRTRRPIVARESGIPKAHYGWSMGPVLRRDTARITRYEWAPPLSLRAPTKHERDQRANTEISLCSAVDSYATMQNSTKYSHCVI